MVVDGTDLDAESAYKPLIGGIVPRAIAWASTRPADGIDNLAPVSSFAAAGRKPPKVSLTLQPRSDRITLKDTVVNVRDTGEFVTNMTTLPTPARSRGSSPAVTSARIARGQFAESGSAALSWFREHPA
jgi:flavin reductase (DIM6/NTAB) family NADH-FMN oxidoreductase RutF